MSPNLNKGGKKIPVSVTAGRPVTGFLPFTLPSSLCMFALVPAWPSSLYLYPFIFSLKYQLTSANQNKICFFSLMLEIYSLFFHFNYVPLCLSSTIKTGLIVIAVKLLLTDFFPENLSLFMSLCICFQKRTL